MKATAILIGALTSGLLASFLVTDTDVEVDPQISYEAWLAEHDAVRIDSMKPGDSGWTMPWSMSQDEDGNMWLTGDSPLHGYDEQGGTISLLVIRNGDGTWAVDASLIDWRGWDREEGVPHSGDILVSSVQWPVPTPGQ